MANNRLYLGDKENGQFISLAKGWGCGWDFHSDLDLIKAFLKSRYAEGEMGHKTHLIIFSEYDEIYDIAIKDWEFIRDEKKC